MRPAWFNNSDSEKSARSANKTTVDTYSPRKPTSNGSPQSRRWSMQQMLPLPMRDNSEKSTNTEATAPPSPPSSPTKPVAGGSPMGGASRRWSMQPMSFTRSPSVNLTPRQEFLEQQAQKLKSESDISFLLENPEQFAKLKRELRRSGAVTNSVLMHGIHFYARDHAQRVAVQ